MRNTPWALPLALPLGYVGPMAAALPWSLAMLGLLAASVRILWKLFGGAASHFDWLGYCFPPALFCVILGQTSVLLLFGLSLFLRFHKSRPFAAGAALWFCTIKPHLFLPFALVLLVWIFVSRSYRILAGGAAAFAAGALLTTWIDPAAWSQYAYYMRTSVITREFTPCLGAVLRDSIHPAWEGLAFVPAAIGCVWALAWFWPRRQLGLARQRQPARAGFALRRALWLDLRSRRGRTRDSVRGLPQRFTDPADDSCAALYRGRSSDHLALRAALGDVSVAGAGVAGVVSLCARLFPAARRS